MQTRKNGSQTIQAGEKLLTVIEKLQELDGAGVAELADHLDFTNSTTHRYLATLEERDYVVKKDDTYRLGLKFFDIGVYTITRERAYVLAKPKVEELAEQTQERVQFVVEEHGEAVYVHRKEGQNAVQTDPGLGKRIPLHVAAAGKEILAYMPKSEVRQIIDQQGLAGMTEQSITDEEELFTELERSHDRGYSINENEILHGLSAVGVAIRGRDGYPIGALSISCPTDRLSDTWGKEDLPKLLRGTANELELNISHARST